MKKREWNSHYKKNKSVLTYPDENLVRLIAREIKNNVGENQLNAIDIGCGSGRHMALLENSGIGGVYGTDYSLNALNICKDAGLPLVINCDNKNMPFREETFDIAIAWGSLHYSSKDEMRLMLEEVKRIIKRGGSLFATIRRDNDTYLKTGTHLGNNTWSTGLDDLTGTVVSFFNEDELKDIFSIFESFSYGWMERTVIGDTSKVISHWIISAKK
ncbi:MAG TPA: methyltransferase domain-containing protein [Spirochaetota bacterium]|nr:methyltransferase domain-containing protein [Spirochaetota bacterium]